MAAAVLAHVEALEGAEYKRANPGDYDCPRCLYTTLKYGASRCPKCHGTVNDVHWKCVREREAAKAERRRKEEARRREEWERTKPEREREANRRRDRTILRYLLTAFFWIVLLWLLPFLSGLTSGISSHSRELGFSSVDPRGAQISVLQFLAIPAVNWLGLCIFIGHFHGTPIGEKLLVSSFVWALCACVARFVAAFVRRN